MVYKQDRLKYINALESARTKDSLQPFFDFMFRQYSKFLKQEMESWE